MEEEQEGERISPPPPSSSSWEVNEVGGGGPNASLSSPHFKQRRFRAQPVVFTFRLPPPPTRADGTSGGFSTSSTTLAAGTSFGASASPLSLTASPDDPNAALIGMKVGFLMTDLAGGTHMESLSLPWELFKFQVSELPPKRQRRHSSRFHKTIVKR